MALVASPLALATASAQDAKKKGGYIVQHDADVAKNEPAPHDGPGQSVGYVFFQNTPNLHFSFRKLVLKPGAVRYWNVMPAKNVPSNVFH